MSWHSMDCATFTAEGLMIMFAIVLGSTLPLPVGRVVDARLSEKLFLEIAVGTFQRAHEDAFLGPALPHPTLGARIAVVANTSLLCAFVTQCRSRAHTCNKGNLSDSSLAVDRLGDRRDISGFHFRVSMIISVLHGDDRTSFGFGGWTI